MTPRFLRAMVGVLDHEGGFTNDARDPGGQTRWGISHRSYPQEDIQHLSLERALELYWRDYWQVLGLDAVASDVVACKLLDVAVNVGGNQATRLVQQALNQATGNSDDVLLIDGVLGAKTLQAINRARPALLVAMLCGVQWRFYEKLATEKPDLRRFLNGWTVRAMYLAYSPGTVVY